MFRRKLMLWLAGMAMLTTFAAPELRAQYAQPPDAYSVTEVNSMMGPVVNMQVFRDGSKALVDTNLPAQQAGGKATHTRTFYDLHSQVRQACSRELSTNLDQQLSVLGTTPLGVVRG